MYLEWSSSATKSPKRSPVSGFRGLPNIQDNELGVGVLAANFSPTPGLQETTANRQLVIQAVALHVGPVRVSPFTRDGHPPFLFLLSKEVDLSRRLGPDVSCI
ncbi:hypothetical protein KM043_017279 [Ampulex compressa]|nr:hypothetical protein KM043_017279 [Ampulex compressa]